MKEDKAKKQKKTPEHGKKDFQADMDRDKNAKWTDVFTEEDFEDEAEPMEDNSDRELSSGSKKSLRWPGGRKPWIIGGCCIAALAVIYIGISVFFVSHFYINTEINGKDFSGKSTADVKEYIQEQVKGYELKILEKDGKTDTINGNDISLKYKENKDVETALNKQNPFLWPVSLFSRKSEKVTIEVAYDEALLDQKIGELQAVKVEQTPAENARPEYDGEKYVVKEEVYGTAVNMEQLKEKVHQYITEFRDTLDMVEEKCYAEPKYTADSKEVQAACEEMNKYIQASITYPMNESVVVDRNLINQWLSVDDNMQVVFNTEAMKQWFTAFGDKYDTVGITRTFTTPSGKTATVTGGTYGWSINEEAELVNLQNSIRNGEVVTREPAYYSGGTAAVHAMPDWGNTYIDVDLTTQEMWFVQNGAIALHTSVVTGVPVPEKITPEGTYTILEMSRNEVLVGNIQPDTGKPEYETPVDYWMRVTWSGIGFHDAKWQPAFGGNLYQNGYGSHGCINMPVDQAAALYSMISVGTPVVIHY